MDSGIMNVMVISDQFKAWSNCHQGNAAATETGPETGHMAEPQGLPQDSLQRVTAPSSAHPSRSC